jgi:hypothetical protein
VRFPSQNGALGLSGRACGEGIVSDSPVLCCLVAGWRCLVVISRPRFRPDAASPAIMVIPDGAARSGRCSRTVTTGPRRRIFRRAGRRVSRQRRWQIRRQIKVITIGS